MNHFSLQAKELWRQAWNIYIWKGNRIGPLKKSSVVREMDNM
jgi:hypothetical protein